MLCLHIAVMSTRLVGKCWAMLQWGAAIGATAAMAGLCWHAAMPLGATLTSWGAASAAGSRAAKDRGGCFTSGLKVGQSLLGAGKQGSRQSRHHDVPGPLPLCHALQLQSQLPRTHHAQFNLIACMPGQGSARTPVCCLWPSAVTLCLAMRRAGLANLVSLADLGASPGFRIGFIKSC